MLLTVLAILSSLMDGLYPKYVPINSSWLMSANCVIPCTASPPAAMFAEFLGYLNLWVYFATLGLGRNFQL